METYLRVMEMYIYSLNHVDMENQSQSTSQVLHKLTSKDLAILVNELNPLASQCHALGLQLELCNERLHIIKLDYHKCEDQLREIIAVRLNREPPLTWHNIATALRAASVGANRLASELESKYVHYQPPLTVALQTNAHSAAASLTSQTIASTSQHGSFPSGHTLSSVYISPNNSSPKPVHNQSPHVPPQHQNYHHLHTTHYTPSHPSLVEPVGGNNEEHASKRPRIEVLHPELSSQYQHHSARKLDNSALINLFIDYVKTVYRGSKVERDPKVIKWPPTPSEVYINLALINRESNSAKSKKYAEVTEAMVRDGNVDAIANTTKGPIDFEEIAKNIRGSKPNEKRLILVEGAPGVGKSTFAWEFCRRWERGEIAQQYELVLLLRLRDERISKAKSLQDLIYHPLEGVDKAVCTELVYSRNLNGLLILEGFDELPDSGRNDHSVFMQLISGELLPLATVLVTSRPWATWVIR